MYAEHESYGSRSDAIYAEPLPMDGSPHISLAPETSSLHMNRVGDNFHHPMGHSPGSSYRDFEHSDGGVKMEDHSPVIISSQSGYVHAQQQSSQMPLAGYMSPHGIPIQHTDDAASKETQYLRRRCFNCHTTEPPSWRRSTLTPGKIVCNKCGLYERTHLRPRPLRFDELRAGNKSRKQSKTTSPKGGKIIPPGPLPIKKEPSDMEAISRRMSVSSNNSVQSNGASSDWDDGSEFHSMECSSIADVSFSVFCIFIRIWSQLRVQFTVSAPVPHAKGSQLPVPARFARFWNQTPQRSTVRHRFAAKAGLITLLPRKLPSPTIVARRDVCSPNTSGGSSGKPSPTIA